MRQLHEPSQLHDLQPLTGNRRSLCHLVAVGPASHWHHMFIPQYLTMHRHAYMRSGKIWKTTHCIHMTLCGSLLMLSLDVCLYKVLQSPNQNTPCSGQQTHNATLREHPMTWCFTAQPSTRQHNIAQHSTAQHSTAQHSTAQHSTAQHNTASAHLQTVATCSWKYNGPWALSFEHTRI